MRATSKLGKKPVYASVLDNDTLYISALILTSSEKYITKNDTSTKLMIQNDSLNAEQLYNKVTDTLTYFTADKEVILYSRDLQAISDSLQFDGRDSIFTFYRDPVLWTDSTQMTGDTVAISLRNEKVNDLKIFKNCFVLTSPDYKFFNQIKGRALVAAFDEEGKISKMNITGNAQLRYYMIDDEEDAYIGVNLTECSSMSFIFDSSKIQQINFYSNPSSSLLPMKGTDHEKIKLEGFKNRFDERPKSSSQVFTYKAKKGEVSFGSSNPKTSDQNSQSEKGKNADKNNRSVNRRQ
jgi:hypothetical protein